MPIDASIPLQTNKPPDPLAAATRAYTLKAAMQQAQMGDFELHDQLTLRDASGMPDVKNPDGTMNIGALLGHVTGRVSPKTTLTLTAAAQQQEQYKRQQQEAKIKMHEAFIKASADPMASIYTQYQQDSQKVGPEKAWEIAQPKTEALRQQLSQTFTGMNLQPMKSPDQLAQAASHSQAFIKNQMRANQPETPHELKTDAIGQERNRIAADKAAKSTATDVAGKVPAGYRKKADGTLEFIPGGPADPEGPKKGALGSRESVFINRVATSASEAAADLGNVVQLPITSSTGIFGGRKQGESIFAAGKETLANKMTSQEVQSYNVMSAGFQRSLASIEASGLAPSGTLSHQMDAVIFKEGDTNLTKLHKLAQTRQIVEKGLEVALSNPRVPKEQKAQMESSLEALRKAVPFTHTDVINLQRAQEKNPKTTLKDVMRQDKLDKADKKRPPLSDFMGVRG